MSTQPQDNTTSTTVQIFGTGYSIRSQSEPEYVQKVAGMVDEAMRRVSTRRVMRSNEEIAVLAAMHLVGELLQAQEELDGVLNRVVETTEALAQVLQDGALGEDTPSAS
jgi:cell division protein ZapA (FtsZ GTPase activity inhibitor)